MADDKLIPDVDSLLDTKQFEEAVKQLRAGVQRALAQTAARLKTGRADFSSTLMESVLEIEVDRLDKLSTSFQRAIERLEKNYLYDTVNLSLKEEKAVEQQDGSLSEEQMTFWAEQRTALQTTYLSRRLALERRHARAVGEIQEGVNALFSEGNDRRIEKARKYYAEIMRWADTAAKYQIISEEQASDLIGKAIADSNLNHLRAAEKELSDYLDRRKKLLDQAARKEARLTARGKDDKAEQVSRKSERKISMLDASYNEKYDLAGMVSTGIGKFGAIQVKQAVTAARQELTAWQAELDELQARKKEQEAAGGTTEPTDSTSGTADSSSAPSTKQPEAEKTVTDSDIQARTTAMAVLQAQITAAEKSIKERNPFVALALGIEKYRQAKESGSPVGQDIKEIATAAAGSIDKVKGIFDAAREGISALGNTLGFELSAETEQILGDVSKMMGSASSLATGIASGNPAQILTGAIGVFTSLYSLFDGKSRRAEQRIQALQKEIDGLSAEYAKRTEEIKETNDISVYKKMEEQKENLQAQQEKIREQINEEQSKKNTDDAKVAKWNEQIATLQKQEAELEKQRLEMLAGTTASSAIDQFAEALVGAYDDAEKSAQKLQETTRSILSTAVKDSLKKQFLAQGIEEAVAYLGESMANGELTPDEENEFKRRVEEAGEKYRANLAAYEHLFPTEKEAEKPAAGIRGEISEKITEETASRLEGLFRLGVDLQSKLLDLGGEQLETSRSSLHEVAEIARTNIAIEQNTRRTADNTDGLRDRLDIVAAELKAIKNNTENRQVWAQN